MNRADFINNIKSGYYTTSKGMRYLDIDITDAFPQPEGNDCGELQDDVDAYKEMIYDISCIIS